MTSLRSAPECLGICSASPAYVPRPTDELCASCGLWRRTSLRRCVGYAACSPLAPWPRGRWDYRTPCPDTGVAEIFLSAPAARPRSPRSSFPATWYRERWRRRSPPPSARRRPRQLCYVSCLVYRDPWDLGRRDPPKTRLAHRPIGTLPIPVDAAEFLAVFDQDGPD